jgi:hypothetical protein
MPPLQHLNLTLSQRSRTQIPPNPIPLSTPHHHQLRHYRHLPTPHHRRNLVPKPTLAPPPTSRPTALHSQPLAPTPPQDTTRILRHASPRPLLDPPCLRPHRPPSRSPKLPNDPGTSLEASTPTRHPHSPPHRPHGTPQPRQSRPTTTRCLAPRQHPGPPHTSSFHPWTLPHRRPKPSPTKTTSAPPTSESSPHSPQPP